MEYFSHQFSAYDFNPFDFNPLRYVVCGCIDFDRVNDPHGIKLF